MIEIRHNQAGEAMQYSYGCFRHLYRASLILTALTATAYSLALTANAASTETVEIHSVEFTHQPSPFKLRQAKKQNRTLLPEVTTSIPLIGYLSLPDKAGPYPAAIILHTCASLTDHERHWSDILVSWGYAVLMVDSLATRNVDYICDDRVGSPSPWTRALDAHGAKHYLETRLDIDPKRIAVFGLSHGATSAIEAIRISLTGEPGFSPFTAAIAFYPYCTAPAKLSSPLLILTGSEDSWTPVEICNEFKETMPQPHELQINEFAGAYHGFDHPDIDILEMGFTVRSNKTAAKIARQNVKRFLEKWNSAE